MVPSWDEAWMSVADAIGRRSRCRRDQVGAVIVDATNRIVATGYNGYPAGLPGECRLTCERYAKMGQDLSPGYDDCPSIHAESNALMFCDRREREGGTIYVNSGICYTCAKLVANSGLARVVMANLQEHREPERSMQLLRDSGLEVWIYGVHTR